MMNTLPTELKLVIVKQLDPWSILSFALTSKLHFYVCQSILRRHAQFFSEYRVITVGEKRKKNVPSGYQTIWSLLKDVLLDTQKGVYVRELNIPLNRQHENKAFGSISTSQCPLSSSQNEDKTIFTEAARALQPLYRTTEESEGLAVDSSNAYLSGLEDRLQYDGTITAILMHHAPNLARLRISGMKATYFLPIMNYIAQRYEQPNKAWQLLPLQNLTTAAITPLIHEGGISNIDWVYTFFRLPSLRTFAAHCIPYAVSSPPLRTCRPAVLSNVTTLFFYHCRFNLALISEILASVPALTKFAYIIGSGYTSRIPYQPRELLDVIAAWTKDSLEELVLNLQDFREEDKTHTSRSCPSPSPSPCVPIEDADRCLIGELRCFTKLKILDCRWLMIRPPILTPPHLLPSFHPLSTQNPMLAFDITRILPINLEGLFLDGILDNADWELLIQQLNNTEQPRTAHRSLPNLTKVCLRRYGSYYSNLPDEVFSNVDVSPDYYLKPYKALFEGYGHY